MAHSTETRPPSPALFFETINAYQRTEALKAAIELDLFTAIGEGKRTAEAIADARECAERGARILGDYLVVMGFLTKDGSQYGLTADSAVFLDRYQTRPGSALEVELGSGYDLALITNFLHHFDPPACEGLLRKVHAALAPGGRAVTLEFVPNEDRVSPPVAAAFSLMMLGSTPHGNAYTFAELERMFRHAGFSSCELHPLPPTEQQVVIATR